MTSVALGPGGEFDRIRAIAAALGDSIGAIGNDTARIPAGDGALVVSVDAAVENVHFRRGWLSLEEVGWRATAAALSDLAAAAATPVGVLTTLIVPTHHDESATIDIMRGAGAACASVGARVLGGDLSNGSQWAIVTTVIGRAVVPSSRGGARAGDGLWVTGTLGGARAAVEAWNAGLAPDDAARAAFARPEPRIAAGQWLAAHGATAMMDVSDGVGGDVQHLAAASEVHIDLELERLPVHPSASTQAERIGEDPALFAATGGEDYELLVTLPEAFDNPAAFETATGLPLTRIGRVTDGAGVRATLRGTLRQVHGYRHQV